MSGLKQVFILITYITVLTVAQYIDDSDYEDYSVYGEPLPHKPRHGQQIVKEVDTIPDDFYIINDYEETVPKRDTYSVNDEIEFSPTHNDRSIEMIKPPYQQVKWLREPEKIYQYTKHRISGYDYDELDFMGGRRFNKCDMRSSWSHCVCQFTCTNPNEVDCYMPCISGCECKEAFVFDENTQQCISPEMCPKQNNFDVYRK